MQDIYLPNRFYVTFPHGNFSSFDKMLNIIKNDIYAFIQVYNFSSFLPEFNELFLSKLCEIFSCRESVNVQ